MTIMDLRTIATEWRDALQEREWELEGALAEVRPDPRFPRLSLAHRQRCVELAHEEDGIDPDVDATELCEGLGIDPDPDSLESFGDSYEPTLIPEYDFEEYAEQLAEDVGAIDRTANWPLSHIDWEAAAYALKQDYTSVDWNGTTYYIRSC